MDLREIIQELKGRRQISEKKFKKYQNSEADFMLYIGKLAVFDYVIALLESLESSKQPTEKTKDYIKEVEKIMAVS